MTVLEGMSLCVVLLFSLYGCAQAATQIVRWILRPREPRVRLVLSSCKKEELEQQVRFARWLSAEWAIPIRMDLCDLDEEAQDMMCMLLKEKFG